MDCFVCHKESSQLSTLLETGFQTLKDAARAGDKILPPDVIIGVLYHNSCRSSYKRSLYIHEAYQLGNKMLSSMDDASVGEQNAEQHGWCCGGRQVQME